MARQKLPPHIRSKSVNVKLQKMRSEEPDAYEALKYLLFGFCIGSMKAHRIDSFSPKTDSMRQLVVHLKKEGFRGLLLFDVKSEVKGCIPYWVVSRKGFAENRKKKDGKPCFAILHVGTFVKRVY